MSFVATRRFVRNPVAVAATLVLIAGVAPVQAQSFSQSAANNNTFPNNLLPYAGNPAVLDFTGDAVYIGNGGIGSFSGMAGALLKADSLSIGNGGTVSGTNIGTVTATGAGTRFELGGSNSRLDVGSWGTGTMTVSAGAVVDATLNPGACAGNSCFNVVGNGAGSTANLTITGTGSAVRTLRNTNIGQSSVYTDPPSGFVFGTPGGTTTATVSVEAGGLFATEYASVGFNNRSPNGNGQERAFGTVNVNGTGSTWLLTYNTIDNSAAGLTIGQNLGGQGTVNVSNGGVLSVDGRLPNGSNGPGPNDFVNIGVNGGKGIVTVTGVGSRFDVIGFNSVLQVGRSGTTLDGLGSTFSVLAGASASALYINVGRDGAKGTLVLDGVGSRIDQLGVASNQAFEVNGPPFASIGRNGATGAATVSGGGVWTIGQNGGDSSITNFSPGLSLGRDASSSGSLLITGAGSKVEVISTSINPATGVGDNNNPFVGVGYDNPLTTSGTLTVSAGGQLLLTGNAVSTVAIGRTTSLSIGGRGDALPGTGTATVTGAGSKIVVSGNDAYIGVGRGNLGGEFANGTLNVLDQAVVESTSLVVGILGTGTMSVDNATVALSGFRTNANPAVGAGSSIGRGAGGNGALTLSNGATFTITPTVYTAGMAIGGDQFLGGGTGTVTLSGGSSIVIGGPLIGNGFTVGRSGTGTVALSGASFVDVGSGGTIDFGRSTGGVGNLSVTSGSWLRGNEIHFGGINDVDAAGSAVATVSGLDSELRAEGDIARVTVGRGGAGSLTLGDQAKIAATFLNVGRAPTGIGSLDVSNSSIELSGQKNLGGTEYGARFNIGSVSGSGVVDIGSGSLVTISNAGSAGAELNLGGASTVPGGSGALSLSGASQIRLIAGTGLAQVNIGHSGFGTAVLSGASSIDAGDGAVYVGREAGSVGTLILTGGSTLIAGYVGIGVSAPYNGVAQAIGGSGTVVLNDSTINADKFEVGAGSVLTGNNGVLNVTGDVIIGGILSPGNSPGRIRINCNIITLPGSQLILDIEDIGNGAYAFDELVLGPQAAFNLYDFGVVFNFIGSTDPNAFAATGQFDLDTFLRAAVGNTEAGLSTTFAQGQTWSTVINGAQIMAVSSAFDVTTLQLQADGSFDVVAVPVPEPSTWGLMFLGLAAVGGMAHWRRRESAQS